MGSQGTICAVYGVVVAATLKDAPEGRERTPILYEVNGRTVADEGEADELPAYGVPEPDIIACIRGRGINKVPPLSVRVLGHDDMSGARGFDGKALVGYCVGSVYDINDASALPPLSKIEGYGPAVVAEIKEQLGLEIEASDLRLHLMFEEINAF